MPCMHPTHAVGALSQGSNVPPLLPSVGKLQSFLSLGCQSTPKHGLSEEEEEESDEEISNMVRNFSLPGQLCDSNTIPRHATE
jgi:hypothetical protein